MNMESCKLDFESRASASSATPAPCQLQRETYNNRKTFDPFSVVLDSRTGLPCHALPYFALPSGTKTGTKHKRDTGGSPLHREAVRRLKDAGAITSGFRAEMRRAFGDGVHVPNIRPDAFLINTEHRVVTLFEVVVTSNISEPALDEYWHLHHDLRAKSINLWLTRLEYISLRNLGINGEGWSCERDYFTTAGEYQEACELWAAEPPRYRRRWAR